MPDAIGLVFATALAGLLTRPIWSTNSSPGGFDNLFYTGPIQTALASSWRNLEPPYWFPDVFLGVPTLSNPQTYAFYPISQAFNVALGVPRSMDASIVFHTFLLIYGCYFLGRRGLRVTALPALVLTVTVCCCTAFVVDYGRIEQIQVLSWMPWTTAMILIAARALESRNTRRLLRDYAVLGTLLGLAFMAGHPQSFLMVGVVAFVVFVAATPWHPARLVLAIGTTLVGFAALAGIAIQGLVHGMSLTAPQTRTQADLVGFSLNLHDLPGALFPHTTSSAPFNESGNFETTGSISLAALILAILCVLIPKTRRLSRVRTAFALLSIGALAWAVIPTVPAIASLHNTVPLLANERVPGRWLIVAVFSLACLAALGLDGALKRRQWRTNRWRLGIFIMLLAIAVAVWGSRGRVGSAELVLTASVGLFLIIVYWRTHRLGVTGKQALTLILAAGAITYALLIGKTSALTRVSPTFAQATVDESAISKHLRRFPGPTLSIVPDDFSNTSGMITSLRPNAGAYIPSPSPDGYDGGFWITRRWTTFAESSGILAAPKFNRDLTLGHQLSWSPSTASTLRKIGTRYVIAPDTAEVFPGILTVAAEHGVKLVAFQMWRGPAWACRTNDIPERCSENSFDQVTFKNMNSNSFDLKLPPRNFATRIVMPIQYDPNWSAEVPHASKLRIRTEYGFLLSLDVPPNVKGVRFRYSPPYAKLLIAASLSWLVTLGILISLCREPRHVRRIPDAVVRLRATKEAKSPAPRQRRYLNR